MNQNPRMSSCTVDKKQYHPPQPLRPLNLPFLSPRPHSYVREDHLEGTQYSDPPPMLDPIRLAHSSRLEEAVLIQNPLYQSFACPMDFVHTVAEKLYHLDCPASAMATRLAGDLLVGPVQCAFLRGRFGHVG